MLNLYNINNKQKITNSDELLKSFYEKGLSLLKNKKLKNLDFILFIKTVQNLVKENQQFLKYFPDAIDFNENNKEFLNQILNSDSFKLKEYLGGSYNTIIEKIFEKFVAPKDLLALRKWDLGQDTPKNMVEIFLKTIQRIWVNNPESYMYGLENLFAKEFAVASVQVNNFKSFLDIIEEKVAKEKIMVIYSNILWEEYKINTQFKEHIKEYIRNYDKKTPRYIWCLMTTYPNIYSRVDFLENYLKSDSEHLAVKYTDFVHYPSKVEETIFLFANLRNKKIIPIYFEDSVYYKNSMNAKNYIEQNLFKDAIIMYPNLSKLEELLESFFIEKSKEDLNDCLKLIINFKEKFEKSKRYYDSLKKIENYWTSFFPKDKSGDLIKLKNAINNFENKKLEDCAKEIELNNEFNNYLNEAEEGTKLKGSIIFMELYDSLKSIENERTRFDECFKKFNEIIILGKNCNLNALDNKLKKVIINAVYKNIDLLNEELIFIRNYFNFDKNQNNFNIEVLRNNIVEEVKIIQKNKEDC